jgi:hypothetical protein
MHEQAGRHARAHAGLEARQQRNQIGGNQQESQPLDDPAPRRHDEEMLLQDARHRMGLHQYRGHGRRHRRDENAADAGGRRADQHDLVLVLVQRDLAAGHIEERIHLERRLAVAILVEEGVHLHDRIGADLQAAETHRVTQLDLDVGNAQIEALRRNHQRQGGINLVEVGQDQRFGADAAIDIGVDVEMPDCGCAAPKLLDHRRFDIGREQRRVLAFLDLGDAVLPDEVRQRPVRPSARLSQAKQHRQGDIARLGDGIAHAPVGIELLLRLGQHRPELPQGRQLGGKRLRRARQRRTASLAIKFDQLVDVGESRVDLGLGKEDGGGDDLGLGRCQRVDHFCMHFARPGPAAEVVDALLVDGNDGDLAARLARDGTDAEIIGLPLQALQQFAAAGKEHDHAHDNANEPVGFPESLRHAALPSPAEYCLYWRSGHAHAVHQPCKIRAQLQTLKTAGCKDTLKTPPTHVETAI